MSLSNGNCIRCTLITSIIIAIVCTKHNNNDTHDTLRPRLWPTKNSCLHTSIIPTQHVEIQFLLLHFYFYYINIYYTYRVIHLT